MMLMQEASVSNGERMRPGNDVDTKASVSNGERMRPGNLDSVNRERMRPGNDVDARGFSI